MADFLLVLGKANLAMGAAILLVWLLRRVLRAQFGAPLAYALWLLVPITAVAVLLPPRVAAPVPAYFAAIPQPAVRNLPPQIPAAQMPATMPIVQSAPAQPAERIAPMPSVIAAETVSLDTAFFDYVPLLFAGWLVGAVLMALYLARLQARFHASMRSGEAGPAVLGFFRPRVVVPDGFAEQFSAPEQAAILAHEGVHLARQDARINAIVALLRCLCWFNPLVHLGAAWLRMDQELACDATALTGAVSRRDYANALLKSQMMTTLLPLGCNWPGSQHPLIERIELLKHKRPGTARRITGGGLVVFAATFAGLGAWAAQPAVPGKPATPVSVQKQIALAVPPVRNTVANQNSGNIGTPPMADAKSAAGDAVQPIAPAQATKNDIAASGPASALPVESGDNSQMGSNLAAAVNSRLASELRQINNLWNLQNFALKPISPAETQVAAAAPAAAIIGKAPRPQTEAAMKCLNGLGPDGCETLFEESFLARRAIRYCAAEYVHDRLGNCTAGALEALGYLGANAKGEDVFSTKNQAENDTYVIPAPGPDGKIAWWCVSGRPPESTFQPNCSDRHRTDSSAVRVTTRPDSALILYVRPQDHAALQPGGPDGAFIPAAATPAALPASTGIRPEITRLLRDVVRLARGERPDSKTIAEKLRAVETMPNLNRKERNILAQARSNLFGARDTSRAGFGPWPDDSRNLPRVSSYLPPGDVGPNNPN